MAVRSSSSESHQLNLWSGVYSGQRLQILSWLKTHRHRGGSWYSRRLLGGAIKIEPSAMAHPINDLIEAGLVEESASPSPCPITGRNVFKVRLKP